MEYLEQQLARANARLKQVERETGYQFKERKNPHVKPSKDQP